MDSDQIIDSRSFDVIVVGASTSGLYAAEALARAGLEVVVFDREADLNPARRTLIVTEAFSEVLDGGVPQRVELHRSHIMRVAVSDTECEIELLSADSIIERGHLIRRLAETALQAGVAIYNGWEFIRFDQERLVFRSGDGEESKFVARKAVVGADGALTRVGLSAGLGRPPMVPILQVEVNLPERWDPSVTQVWFDVEQTPYFFWLIPESADRGVLGLIGEPGAKLRKSLDRLRERLQLEKATPPATGFTSEHENATPRHSAQRNRGGYQSSQVAMYSPKFKPWGRVGDTPVLLVGDAAGQVKVTTVGGTVTGLVGAGAAVRSILNGTSYRRELKPLTRELKLHWRIRRALDRLDNRGYEELVRVVRGRNLRSFLSRHHRDSMARVFWKLPLIEPRLAKVGWKSLVGRH